MSCRIYGAVALLAASLTLFACQPPAEEKAEETTATETGVETAAEEAATQPAGETATQPAATQPATQPAAKFEAFYLNPATEYPEGGTLEIPEIQKAMAGEEIKGQAWTIGRESVDGADAIVVRSTATDPQNIFVYGAKIPVKEGDKLQMVFEFKPVEGFDRWVYAEIVGPAGSSKDAATVYDMQPKTKDEITTTDDGWSRVERTVDLAGVNEVEVRFPRIPSLTGAVAIRNAEFKLVK